MTAEEMRIRRTCGTTLAPHGEFCRADAFRRGLPTDETGAELSEALLRKDAMTIMEILAPRRWTRPELSGGLGTNYKSFNAALRQFAALNVVRSATDGLEPH